jgi:hypothetical protein
MQIGIYNYSAFLPYGEDAEQLFSSDLPLITKIKITRHALHKKTSRRK